MKTILVPTDFSESAFNAAIYAMELANEFGAKIHLLNVYHIPNPLMTLPIEIVVTVDEMKSAGDSKLKQLANSLKELKHYPVEFTFESRNGFSATEIQECAKYLNADLIVMGMRGAGIVKEKLIGSTVTGIIQKSEIPVLVVPHHARFKPYSKIAFASDGSEIHDRNHLQVVFDLAAKFKCEIEIVNILQPREYAERDDMIDRMEHSFVNSRHSYFFPETDNVSHGIDEFIHQHGDGLLVMIPRKHGFMGNMFAESHTKKLAFHSDIPLLCLHD
jgi:nucleotide-binding universal stress UspA family protein